MPVFGFASRGFEPTTGVDGIHNGPISPNSKFMIEESHRSEHHSEKSPHF